MNISLRDVEERDLLTFFEQQRDPEAAQMAAFQPRDRDVFMAHWAEILRDREVFLKTIVVAAETAGHIVCWQQSGEHKLGYWLGRAHWGRGVATAALSQFLTILPIRPLVAYVALPNLASVRVLQKCGFELSTAHRPRAAGDMPGDDLMLILPAPLESSP